MSATFTMFSDGFALLLAERGTVIIFNGIEKPCLASGIAQRISQESAGFQMHVSSPGVTMLGTDFAALGATHNDEVEVVIAPATDTAPRETLKLVIKTIRNLGTDPTVRLSLQFQE